MKYAVRYYCKDCGCYFQEKGARPDACPICGSHRFNTVPTYGYGG